MNESPMDQLHRYIHGIDYPTTKDVVIQTAQRNGAPQDAQRKLETLQTRVAGPFEVLYALRRP